MEATRKMMFQRAAAQRGLITNDQLADLGVGAGQRARLRRNGELVPLSRRVSIVAGAPQDRAARVLAGCLDVGGVASHRTAAALHGLPGFEIGRLPDVLVLGRKQTYGSPLAALHTTTHLPVDDVLEVDGVPVTSVARTLMLLAGLSPTLPIERVHAAVEHAVRVRSASDRWLWWRLEQLRCRGRRGVAVLEAIMVERSGGRRTESWLEREYLRISDAACLPRPMCQARIANRGAFLARVDFLYLASRVVIEVSGAVAHASSAQRAADAERRNQLQAQGHLVLEFTYEQVVGSPDAVVAQVWTVLRGRRAA